MEKHEQNNGITIPKLTTKTSIGYGLASAADSTSYNFAFMFLMYFLTTAAGVPPAAAGIVIMAATLLDAITTPIIGYLSDNCMSKYGRRRPFMLIGGISLAAVVVLLFTNVPLSGNVKIAYYMVLTILFWISYSSFYIPYTTFGAEIALDYDSRTKLRMPATIFNGLGNLMGMVAPMLIIALLMAKGASAGGAWTGVAVCVGIVTLGTILATWKMTKGKELRPTNEELKAQKQQGIFSTYLKVIKLKPYKFLAISCAFFIAAYTFMMVDQIYYITCVMQASETIQSQASLVVIIALIVLTPVVSAIGLKFGKQKTIVICFIISAIFMVIFRFIQIHSVIVLDLYMITFVIANCAYWQLVPAIGYDMAEVYEVKYKEQREGAVVSLNIFFIKVSAAITSGITGTILAFSGYDAALPVQSESAMAGITNLFTIIPAILILIAALAMSRFPLTKEKHAMLLKLIEDETYDQDLPEELNDII